MKILEVTNVLKTGVITCNKAVKSLLIGCSVDVATLTTEQISVEVEQKNGNNLDITKGFVSLRDFIIANTMGDDAQSFDTTDGLYTADCELTDDDKAVHLEEGEVIKIQLLNLLTTRTYRINGIEAPEQTYSINQFENKTMAAEDTRKTFDLSGFEMALLQDDATIQEVKLTHSNGEVCSYDLYELRSLNRAADAVRMISSAGVVTSYISGRVAIPLAHTDESGYHQEIVSLEVRKTAGTLLNIFLKH